jgi:hypothetical protein
MYLVPISRPRPNGNHRGCELVAWDNRGATPEEGRSSGLAGEARTADRPLPPEQHPSTSESFRLRVFLSKAVPVSVSLQPVALFLTPCPRPAGSVYRLPAVHPLPPVRSSKSPEPTGLGQVALLSQPLWPKVNKTTRVALHFDPTSLLGLQPALYVQAPLSNQQQTCPHFRESHVGKSRPRRCSQSAGEVREQQPKQHPSSFPRPLSCYSGDAWDYRATLQGASQFRCGREKHAGDDHGWLDESKWR